MPSKFGVIIAKKVPNPTLILAVKTIMAQVIKNIGTLEFKFEIQYIIVQVILGNIIFCGIFKIKIFLIILLFGRNIKKLPQIMFHIFHFFKPLFEALYKQPKGK